MTASRTQVPGRERGAVGTGHLTAAERRREALSRTSPAVVAMYGLVRSMVDALEGASPWALLYDPPRDGATLRAMGDGLRALVMGLNGQTGSLRQEVPNAETDVIDTVELYVAGIQGMLEPDMRRLSGQLDRLAAQPRREEAETVAELVADAKGKLSSALMAAAANLAGGQTTAGPPLEILLFPEKEIERERTRELVPALAELVAAIRSLAADSALVSVVAEWRAGRDVDPYALAALPALEARIAALLRPAPRHALYAGDYHVLRRRERRLAARIHETLELHAQSWTGEAPPDATRLPRLMALAFEIAALVDVELLVALLGEKTVVSLRSRVVAAEDARGLGPELQGVLPLLAEEDLRTFVDLLHGSVRKRAALQAAQLAPVAAPPSEPLFDARSLGEELLAAEPPPAPVEVVPTTAERLATARRLEGKLRTLLAPRNPHWGAYRMAAKLFAKGGPMPPELVATAQPFVAEVRRELAAELDGVASLGPLPPELAESLRDDCDLLERRDLDPLETRQRVPAAMQRLERVLEALRGAVAALARVREG